MENGELRFYFELAIELGGFTVEELLTRMSSAELTYWRALYGLKAQEQKARSGSR